MEVRKKPKIEAIYPLNTMQQGLLFHHLASDVDQGFLHVQCKLTGQLRVEELQRSWHATLERHAVLRTSVHWKNIDSPLQVVRPDKKMEWTHLDWSLIPVEKQEMDVEDLKQLQKQAGADLEKGPLAHVTLIKMGPSSHSFLWSCHHLLLDGWSASTILKDVFTFYDGYCKEIVPELEAIPSYKTYLSWLHKGDLIKATEFWKKAFSGFSEPSLFNNLVPSSVADHYIAYKIEIQETLSESLKTLAKQHHVTINTLFQGMWSLLLFRHFGKVDISFGTTVSGRSIPFPNIELMAGMFMNVLPVRAEVGGLSLVAQFLQALQSQQQEARNYEFCTNEQITSWINFPEGSALFDCLYVFENYPWIDINSGSVEVGDFHSGLTSTYPVTLIINTGNRFKVHLLVNRKLITQETTEWILTNLPRVMDTLVSNPNGSIAMVLESLDTPYAMERSNTVPSKNVALPKKYYVGPTNNTELVLAKIWRSIFDIDGIGINDNFFDLGGKSMLAIKMFTRIEQEIEIKLSPTTLLEHPTIAGLAGIINKKGTASSDWKNVVPIRPHGQKTPLFCTHAGGGHVFFYNQLAKYVDPERPIYALQPSGLNGEGKMHQSIEEMASDYLEEIQKVHPNGVYHIVVYCFSTALGLEMAIQLERLEKKPNLIVVDTSAISYEYYNILGLKTRLYEFLKRFTNNPMVAVNKMIKKRVSKKIKPYLNKITGDSNQKNIEIVRSNLMELYYNYQWKKFGGNITLLLTPKKNERFNHYVVDSWNKISINGITTIPLEGNHYNLFSEPDVKSTSNAIDLCMNKVENDIG